MKIDKHGFGDTDRTGSQSIKRIYILEFKRVTDSDPQNLFHVALHTGAWFSSKGQS